MKFFAKSPNKKNGGGADGRLLMPDSDLESRYGIDRNRSGSSSASGCSYQPPPAFDLYQLGALFDTDTNTDTDRHENIIDKITIVKTEDPPEPQYTNSSQNVSDNKTVTNAKDVAKVEKSSLGNIMIIDTKHTAQPQNTDSQQSICTKNVAKPEKSTLGNMLVLETAHVSKPLNTNSQQNIDTKTIVEPQRASLGITEVVETTSYDNSAIAILEDLSKPEYPNKQQNIKNNIVVMNTKDVTKPLYTNRHDTDNAMVSDTKDVAKPQRANSHENIDNNIVTKNTNDDVKPCYTNIHENIAENTVSKKTEVVVKPHRIYLHESIPNNTEGKDTKDVAEPQKSSVGNRVRFQAESETYEFESLPSLLSSRRSDDIESYEESYGESYEERSYDVEYSVHIESDNSIRTQSTVDSSIEDVKHESNDGNNHDNKDVGFERTIEDEEICEYRIEDGVAAGIAGDSSNGSAKTSGFNNFGCCQAINAFEIEYDPERFKKKKKRMFTQFVFTYHRWKSFRENRRARFKREKQLANREKQDEERTLSSGEASCTESEEDDNDDNDNNNNKRKKRFPEFLKFWGRKRNKQQCDMGYYDCSNEFSYAYWAHRAVATIDADILAMNQCNEHARTQYLDWKRAATQGPIWLETCSFVFAFLLLVSSFLISAFVVWTEETIASWCFFLITDVLILILQCRPAYEGFKLMWRNTQGLLQYSSRRKKSRNPSNDEIDVSDCYHATTEIDEEVGFDQLCQRNFRNIRLFRYMYGRGLLWFCSGAMSFALIPSQAYNKVGVAIAIGIPGIALTIAGTTAIFAGIHSVFRWTLLETSIVGDDDYLYSKFALAGRSFYDVYYDSDEETYGSGRSKSGRRLDRNGFFVLVTTLGLDLEEHLSNIYMREVRPKNPDAMTFEEFKKWWLGKPRSGLRRRSQSPVIGRRSSLSPSRPKSPLSKLKFSRRTK